MTQEPKMININKWCINETIGYYLVSYTATWCAPCQRAKPILLEYVKGCQHEPTRDVERSKRPDHVKFIPWFDIVNFNGEILESIQSSKEDELVSFFKRFK